MSFPSAGQAESAVRSPVPGVLVFENRDGSSTVPTIRDDGGIQISTVIERADAPRRYDYSLSLPSGSHLSLTADGGVRADGPTPEWPELHVAPPWAKDAEGEPVPTHYEVHGTTLTQIIDFTPSTAFPVVADPSVYVDYTTAKVINLQYIGVVPRWHYLNACSAAAGKSCTVSRTYSATTTVETSLGVDIKTVNAGVGYTNGSTVGVIVTCGVPKGPGKVALYAQANKKTYRVQTTRHYGVVVAGSGLKTQTKTSGLLTAFRPNGRYSCV